MKKKAIALCVLAVLAAAALCVGGCTAGSFSASYTDQKTGATFYGGTRAAGENK